MKNHHLLVTIHGKRIPVTYITPPITEDLAIQALNSPPVQAWLRKWNNTDIINSCDIEFHSIELQSVDLFSSKKVGFVKWKVDCTVDGKRIPGICFLRGPGVAILMELICEDGNSYTVLVEQPRIPVSELALRELPAGMMDDHGDFVKVAAAEMYEECGLSIPDSKLIDLTELAYGSKDGGIFPSPGGCDEFIRLLYCNKWISIKGLHDLEGRLTGLREHGELITLRIVKLIDLWKHTKDSKALTAMYLLKELRSSGKISNSSLGCDSNLDNVNHKGYVKLSDGSMMPRLAFGLYRVGGNECDRVIKGALSAGYKHFDCAPVYGNEHKVGEALSNNDEINRSDLFICTKVWNDAQRRGRRAVRESVLKSLNNLRTTYIDLCLIHWPVPGHHIDAYKELELLVEEGKLKSIGLSNYTPHDYEELESSGIKIPPVVNQIEVSVFMYRPITINFFKQRNIFISASKALNRANETTFNNDVVTRLALKYNVTAAQILLRWCIQKNLVAISKTSSADRMIENTNLAFQISTSDMAELDKLTLTENIHARELIETERKNS